MASPAWWETTKDIAIGAFYRLPPEERATHFVDVPMERSSIFLRLLAHWLDSGIPPEEALARAAKGWEGMYVAFLRTSTRIRE